MKLSLMSAEKAMPYVRCYESLKLLDFDKSKMALIASNLRDVTKNRLTIA